MSKNVDQVKVGVDGIIASAPLGTSGPTTVDGNLNVAFKDLGYVSDAGVTETNERTHEMIRAWQNGRIVRTIVTEGQTTFSFTLLQTSKDVIAEYYGAVVAADGSIVTDPHEERPRRAYVLDVVDGTDKIRKYIPNGQITEVGDIVYANGEPVGYEVTLMCYHDEAMNGSVKHWFKSLETSQS
jgi:hypothetical protein